MVGITNSIVNAQADSSSYKIKDVKVDIIDSNPDDPDYICYGLIKIPDDFDGDIEKATPTIYLSKEDSENGFISSYCEIVKVKESRDMIKVGDYLENVYFNTNVNPAEEIKKIDFNVLDRAPNYENEYAQSMANLIVMKPGVFSSDSTVDTTAWSVEASPYYKLKSKVLNEIKVNDSISQLYYSSYESPDLRSLNWYTGSTSGSITTLNLITGDTLNIIAVKDTNRSDIDGYLYTIRRSDNNAILWCSENGRNRLGVFSKNGWVDNNLIFNTPFTVKSTNQQKSWEVWFSSADNNWTEPYIYNCLMIANGWGGLWWIDPEYIKSSDTSSSIWLLSKSDFDENTGWFKKLIEQFGSKLPIPGLLNVQNESQRWDFPPTRDMTKISSLRDQDIWASFISKDGDFSAPINYYNGYRIKIYSSRPLSTTIPLIELK